MSKSVAVQKAAKGTEKSSVAPRRVEKNMKGAVRPGHNVKKVESVAADTANQQTRSRIVLGNK
jgi:hypothetical protein